MGPVFEPVATDAQVAELAGAADRIWHDYWPALIGEVSMCNDDNTDNRFLKPLGRFPTIEEDEPAYRLLCTEYPAAE